MRNPIFRQMLKMQDIPCDEFVCNARGMNPVLNFPTSFSSRKKIHQQPASENETRALIRIFQEYGGRGLLIFCGFSADSFLRKGLTNPHEFYIIEKMFN